MNPNIKAVIGEADMHSPTERAVLDREATPPGTIEPHGETDTGNPEESKEVQLAQQIIAAIKGGDTAGAIRAAHELIQMHGEQPGAANPMGGHVQPVPHPQPPRALDYAPPGIGDNEGWKSEPNPPTQQDVEHDWRSGHEPAR